MAKSAELRIRDILGDHVIAIANLMTQVETLQEQIVELSKPKEESKPDG